MNPNDNQTTASNAFSGSSLGAPSPAPYDAAASPTPFSSTPQMTGAAQPDPVNAFGTNDPYQAPDDSSTDNTADTDSSNGTPAAATPLNDFLNDDSGPSFLDDKPAGEPASAPQIDDATSSDNASTQVGSGSHDDLSSMKQQALTQLQPLVDHLEQSADEQFKTTMMMIQATDDQTLLKKAFEAAQKIEDDKERAQALLDFINEINYFSQQKDI